MKIPQKLALLLKHLILPASQRKKIFSLAQQSLLLSDKLSAEERALLEKVSLEVHPLDRMYFAASAEHYLSIGLCAIRCIEYALQSVHRTSQVISILDFPSGSGRITRFLRARFPQAQITAADIDRTSLAFCKKHFSAQTFLSQADFTKLKNPQKFDLIWCGSLLTHLDENRALSLLKFFYDHLALGGICVFTTHGQRAANWIWNKIDIYNLNEAAQEEILRQFKEKGYGYIGFKNKRRLGISLISHSYMTALANGAGQWKAISYQEHGWDTHQDVYGFQKP